MLTLYFTAHQRTSLAIALTSLCSRPGRTECHSSSVKTHHHLHLPAPSPYHLRPKSSLLPSSLPQHEPNLPGNPINFLRQTQPQYPPHAIIPPHQYNMHIIHILRPQNLILLQQKPRDLPSREFLDPIHGPILRMRKVLTTAKHIPKFFVWQVEVDAFFLDTSSRGEDGFGC